MSSTRVSRHLNAPRATVYRALLDPDSIAKWRVPAAMTSRVHEFDAREGGRFRVSLTYDGGTELVGVHEGLPPGVPAADNETGWREALARLAELVEGGWRG